MDFTFSQYTQLLKTLQSRGFLFYTFAEYITQETIRNPESPLRNKAPMPPRKIILRHDVEARYENALQMARIQHKMGIRGSYYFRFLPKSYSSEIIKEIADLGHEIGYHYDDLSACKGNREEALKRFQQHLEELRKIAPVQTISMEGAPLSPYDNRDLWKPEATEHKNDNGADQQRTTPALRCGELVVPSVAELNKACTERSLSEHRTKNTEHGTKLALNTEQGTPNKEHRTKNNKQPYNQYGILAEPYFDIDFNKMFYLTDTGRRWDGWKTSVRDKVPQQAEWVKQGLVFHSTKDIIQAIEKGRSSRSAEALEVGGVKRLSSGADIRSSSGADIRSSSGAGIRSSSGVEMPDQIMMTFHPQRWNDKTFPWLKELLIQNLKNQIKKLLIKRNS